MKAKSLWNLYRTALETLNPSADTTLEQLRWRITRGQMAERVASPELVGRLCAKDDTWSGYAFDDLRRTGFVEINTHELTWRNHEKASLGASLDALAALEAAAILRSQFLDLSPAHDELDFHLEELKRITRSGEPLAIVLALQRLWLTLVASIGSTALLSSYMKLSNAGLCYAWAEALSREDLPDLVTCAGRFMELLAAKEARKATQVCSAIRAHPVTGEAKAIVASL